MAKNKYCITSTGRKPWEDLAVAVCKLLVQDYRTLFKQTVRKKNKYGTDAHEFESRLRALDKDLHSEWIYSLGCDGEVYAPKIQKQVLAELIKKGEISAERAIDIMDYLADNGIIKRYKIY